MTTNFLGSEQASLQPTPLRRAILQMLGDLHFGVRMRGWYLECLLRDIPTAYHILDVGCSQGQMSFWLARRFPLAHVTGVDVDAALVRQGRQLAQTLRVSNLQFRLGDITKYAPGEQFDLIVCFDVLEHVPDWQAAVTQMAHLLLPAGQLFIHVPQSGLFQNPQFGLRRWVRPATLPAISPEHVREGFSAADFDFFNTVGITLQVTPTFGVVTMWLHTAFEAYRDYSWAWRVAFTPMLLALAQWLECTPPARGGGLLIRARRAP